MLYPLPHKAYVRFLRKKCGYDFQNGIFICHNFTVSKLYHMTNEQQTTQSLNERYALISGNICTQLVALQGAINAREEGQRHPTAQDIAMQCKLIGCLDKLRKLSGEKAIARPKRVTQQTPETTETPTNTPATQKAEAPPITEQDFKDYKHLLNTFRHIRDNETIRFRGRLVNSKWLHYNLLQYCLPQSERRFMGDARRVIAEVNMPATLEKANPHLQQNMAA